MNEADKNNGAESFRSAEFELSTPLIAPIGRWVLPNESKK